MTCQNKVQDNLVKFLANLILKFGYGSPDILLSDNGNELTNRLMECMHNHVILFYKINIYNNTYQSTYDKYHPKAIPLTNMELD